MRGPAPGASVKKGSTRTPEAVTRQSRPILQRACTCGHPATGAGECAECGKKNRRRLQAKLEVTEPGDVYEREADRIADQVMAQPAKDPDQASPRRAECSAVAPAGLIDAAPAVVDEVLATSGRPLAPGLRHDMERRFGHDFGRVRVHVGDRAADSAAAVGAAAYTVGQQVVFGRGRFDPVSATGRKLIAHELVHTLQQRGSGNGSGGAPHGNAAQVPTPSPLALARQPSNDIRQLQAEIAFLRAQLLMPVSPLRGRYLTRLRELERQLSSKSPAPRSDEEAKEEAALRAKLRQSLLNKKAVQLAQKQAKRREFWNSMEDSSAYFIETYLWKSEKFRKQVADLDLYWDKDREGFVRDPKVDALEREVVYNAEANGIYNRVYWDLTENKPAEKSWFDDVVGFVCEYTNPCHDNMEQFHADLESGMSRDDALARGIFRTGLSFVPTKAPRGGPTTPIKPAGPTALPRPVPVELPVPGPGWLLRGLRPAPTPLPGPVWTPKPTVTPTPIPTPPVKPPIPPAAPDLTPTMKATPKPKPKVTPKHKTAPEPKQDPTIDVMPVPRPQVETEQDRRKKRCRDKKDPCATPLPIQWPYRLPLPSERRPLVRTPSGDDNLEPDRRSAPQRRMQEEINRNRADNIPPPRPCFASEADPNAPYDAHHIHPLYLGGAEDDINLCALLTDRHQAGHPQLHNQSPMLDHPVWVACKICEGYLPRHPGSQAYVIEGRK